ncbi:MAG: methyltransferase domain-containing protein, partial [Candidatus Electrothrix sp. AUS4]|nr:methyltransferase domain-containing protein [Candidatus Electrothrix sp. AUS4]
MDESLAPMWLKTSLDCPEITLEAVVDLLGVITGSAVEETPVKNGRSTVNAFFRLDQAEDQDDVLERLGKELDDLFALYELEPPKPACSLMADEDWATSWQQFFTPFAIIPGLVIKPSWEDYVPAADEQVIEMDPGMAFGTGQHASTKLALGLIRSCCDSRAVEKVLDVGTGTGILAMGAALFGAEQVIAIDNDPEAVRVAGENIAHNRLTEKIAVSGDDLEEVNGSFDLVCANIIHDVLVEMAQTRS